MWYSIDPRLSINKYTAIIILRPISSRLKYETCIAYVEVPQIYCILTSFKDCPYINPDDVWNKEWLWAFLPEEKDIL